jgi:hypothetical protein
MIVEKPLTRKLKLPALFQAIIHNDEQRRITKQASVVSFSEAKRLIIEHKDFMRAAEKATAGTKDKGNALA